MAERLELQSAPHRKIPVSDILPNPHRDFKANPISSERVEQLLESFGRTGFWDNIVVREHPSQSGKFQIAYGHNRLFALKDRRIIVDTVTLPVAKLTDWEMYCAMVDENESQATITPAVAMENINVGCDLVEAALKKIGKSGTWEDFNLALEIRSVVPAGTTLRDKHDGGFEQARSAYFAGEGLGRRFLAEFLPCGMRGNTINIVISSRYGDAKAAAKEAKAEAAAKEAEKKRKQAEAEANAKRKKELEKEAAEEAAAARKLEREAAKIGRGSIAKDVLLLFDTSYMMTTFAEAVRKLEITKQHHAAAAEHVIKEAVKEKRVERTLLTWWDETSGEAAARRKTAKAQEELERMQKAIGGVDFTQHLLKIKNHLRDIEKDIDRAIPYAHLANSFGRKAIEDKSTGIARVTAKLMTLIERSRALPDGKDITPATKMLTHQDGA